MFEQKFFWQMYENVKSNINLCRMLGPMEKWKNLSRIFVCCVVRPSQVGEYQFRIRVRAAIFLDLLLEIFDIKPLTYIQRLRKLLG